MRRIDPMQIIVNPISAYGRTIKKWAAVQEALRRHGLDYTAHFTERRGHARELARLAADQGCRFIVALGGEGTVLGIVNGLADASGRVDPSITLGILPGGTGNDFARVLGLPSDPVAAVARLAGDAVRVIDLGCVECMPLDQESRGLEDPGTLDLPVKGYYLNVAGVGFDGEVAERVERSAKRVTGTIPYLTNLFVSLVAYRNKPVKLWYDGETLTCRVNTIVAANGTHFGGGMFVAPGARPDDGIFDLVVMGDLTKAEVIANLPRLYKGTHITHPKVSVYHAREVRVASEVRALVQADGELMGQAPAIFRVIPQAVRIKV